MWVHGTDGTEDTMNTKQFTTTRNAPVVIVPCSAGKALPPQGSFWWKPAEELYVGPYFTAAMTAAKALTAQGGQVLIMSAGFGLIRPDRLVHPYDYRVNAQDAAYRGWVRHQATNLLGVAGAEHVVLLAGGDYAKVARTVWPAALRPVAGVRIWDQLARMEAIAASGDPVGQAVGFARR